MKNLFKLKLSFFVLVIMAFSSLSQAEDFSSLNMSEPPFWMSSYDEFNDLRSEQKDFYLKNLKEELGKLNKSVVASASWDDAAEWYKSWESIRRRVYVSCKDPKLRAHCDRLADIRVETFDLFANQKLENRIAAAREK